MDISVEKTPKQVLSHYVVDTASMISITHLPTSTLTKVSTACIELNEQAGSAKAVAHIGARNIQSKNELHTNCIAMRKAGVDKVLIIGGTTYEGKVYQTAHKVREEIADYGFTMYCGTYPQNLLHNTHLDRFAGGITQMCLNTRLLNNWINNTKNTRIGVPSNCSVKGLYKYMKICGLTESIAHALGNISGLKYLNSNGFNTTKFVNDLSPIPIHVYNFGKLDQTIMQLEFK